MLPNQNEGLLFSDLVNFTHVKFDKHYLICNGTYAHSMCKHHMLGTLQ